jgi:hypothetical protein
MRFFWTLLFFFVFAVTLLATDAFAQRQRAPSAQRQANVADAGAVEFRRRAPSTRFARAQTLGIGSSGELGEPFVVTARHPFIEARASLQVNDASSVPHYGSLGTGTVRMDQPHSSLSLNIWGQPGQRFMVDCAVTDRSYRITLAGNVENVVQATNQSLAFITQPLSQSGYAIISIRDANPDANMITSYGNPYYTTGGSTTFYSGWRLGGCEITPIIS